MNNRISTNDQAVALGWSFLGDFSRQGVTFLVSIVLARLLLPADFGLVGMSMAFIAILTLFVDGGFSKAWWAADWRSGRSFSFPRLKEISSFGRFVFAANLLSRSITEIYTLFIGKLLPLLFGWLYSFNAFLYSFVAISYLGTLMNSWLIGRDLGFSFRRQLWEFYRWLLLLLLAILPAWGLYFYLQNILGGGAGAKWVSGLSGALLYFSLYVGVSYLIQPSIKQLLTTASTLMYNKIRPEK